MLKDKWQKETQTSWNSTQKSLFTLVVVVVLNDALMLYKLDEVYQIRVKPPNHVSALIVSDGA